jgi:predicted small lipoprotein YifL
MKTALLFLLCMTLLGACGLKGPLYLPEEKPAAEQAAVPDEDTDKEKKKENNAGEESAGH